jgi:hypothetical protein
VTSTRRVSAVSTSVAASHPPGKSIIVIVVITPRDEWSAPSPLVAFALRPAGPADRPADARDAARVFRHLGNTDPGADACEAAARARDGFSRSGGGIAESSIATAAPVHLAVALRDLQYGVGITNHHLRDDLVAAPIRPVAGHVRAPKGAGSASPWTRIASVTSEPDDSSHTSVWFLDRCGVNLSGSGDGPVRVGSG